MKEKINKELVVQSLLVEYQNIHQRVFNQIKHYEGNNVKILTLLGILMFFGFQNYSVTENNIDIIIDILFLFIVPFISLLSLLLTSAHVSKMIIYGDYLKLVECKLNKVLKKEARKLKFCRENTLDWEYWRYANGYMNKKSLFSEISFSTFISITLMIIYLMTTFFRMSYIYNNYYSKFSIYVIGVAIIFALKVIIITIAFVKTLNKRNEQKEKVKVDKLTYE